MIEAADAQGPLSGLAALQLIRFDELNGVFGQLPETIQAYGNSDPLNPRLAHGLFQHSGVSLGHRITEWGVAHSPALHLHAVATNPTLMMQVQEVGLAPADPQHAMLDSCDIARALIDQENRRP